ncbi:MULTISPECIES: prevent-host-death protein [Agrobacterium]|uniref:Type II toxin-antitoxin system prevent-host-death family antitoxin n=1 Tax=Agrobacterium tumefaciens TaxID=358 RepID=A0AAE6BBK2_AGRTU|nr:MULTISPECIES: prevent-host-death protein [Agrobacterium]QCL73369.1 type II toxin-antitoxin system prevent-host-death family antitoxin [Agrobacterium tumefaciens]QCL78943.1 type II toxin-antitoxin system prevent-host-death family antitoxin [Agrobacterium tumefaciens]WCK03548.1 type II toxin-antitoxin system prevent-host-death family antitoxin [Agrobacterium tumefaciens]CUX42781.1 Prevent-host-death family protein [Agrobacterium sp. NCPPB 925]
MPISVTELKGQFTEPARRAEAGDEINTVADAKSRKAALEKIRAAIAHNTNDGPNAAQSRDFLYDEYGLSI